MKIDKEFLKSLGTNKYLEILPEFKKKKARKAETLILTLISISFLGAFAINPTLSTIANLKKQLADNQMAEKQLDQKITNLSLLQQQYSLINSDLSIVTSAIPQTPHSALLLSQVQSIAKTAQVGLTSLQTFPVEIAKIADNLDQDEKENNYSYYSFSLNVEGPYANLVNFTRSLVYFERITTVNNLSFTKNTDNVNELKLSLKGQVYFKK